MNTELKDVHHHMLGLALGALAHANWHAGFHSFDNQYWSELSVVQAGHAAEILIKARIAQEHPLLIFEQTPRLTQSAEPFLGLKDLFERGRTVQYSELPDRLWAATGIRLPNVARYEEFGRLRNCVQHFAAPHDVDCGTAALEFIYEVIDPFIHYCWGLYAVNFCEDSAGNEYLLPTLVAREILFLSPLRRTRNQ